MTALCVIYQRIEVRGDTETISCWYEVARPAAQVLAEME